MINRLIAIQLLWELLCYLCYPRIWFDNSGFGWFQILWIFYFKLLSLLYSLILHKCSIFCIRYTSSTTPNLPLLNQTPHASNYISKLRLQDVYLSSLVIICLPVFCFCYLATTLTIQWWSCHLSKRRRPITSNWLFNLTHIVLKGGKPHVLINS